MAERGSGRLNHAWRVFGTGLSFAVFGIGGLDITPVRITCTPLTLTKGQKWYRVPSRRFHVQLEVGEDLPIAPFLAVAGDTPRGDALAARRVTDHLAHYFDFAGEPSRAGT